MDCTSLINLTSREDEINRNRKASYSNIDDNFGSYDLSSSLTEVSSLQPKIEIVQVSVPIPIDDLGYDTDEDDDENEGGGGGGKKEDNKIVYLALGRTDRVCCAQILGESLSTKTNSSQSQGDNQSFMSDPILVWSSGTSQAQGLQDTQEDDSEENESGTDEEEPEEDEEFITCTALVPSSCYTSSVRACVAIGTNKSHLYVVELSIHIGLEPLPVSMQNDAPSPPCDVFHFSLIASQNVHDALPFILPETIKKMTMMDEINDGSTVNNTKDPDRLESLLEEERSATSTSISASLDNRTNEESTITAGKASSVGSGKSATTTGTAATSSSSAGANDKIHPFHPKGGVSIITTFRQNISNLYPSTIWVGYKDGTAVELSNQDLFPSLLNKSNANPLQHLCNVRISVPINKDTNEKMIPLPISYPSILAPNLKFHSSNPSTTTSQNNNFYQVITYGGTSISDTSGEEEEIESTLSFYSSEDHSSPFLSKNLQGDRKDGELYRMFRENLLGSTRNVMSSLFGSAKGAVQWGKKLTIGGSTKKKTTSTTKSNNNNISSSSSVQGDSMSVSSQYSDSRTRTSLMMRDDSSFHGQSSVATPISLSKFDTGDNQSLLSSQSSRQSPFAALITQEPHYIPLVKSLFDPPRRITSISVDPSGKYAACADTLGRVTLIELSTKQIFRMLKGLRDVSCSWIQEYATYTVEAPSTSSCDTPPNNKDRKIGKLKQVDGKSTVSPNKQKKHKGKQRIITYLVLHGRQRNIIEIWRMKHGGRVAFVNYVDKNAHVLQCYQYHCGDNRKKTVLAKCFLLQQEQDDSAHRIIVQPLSPTEDVISTYTTPPPQQQEIQQELSDNVSSAAQSYQHSVSTTTTFRSEVRQSVGSYSNSTRTSFSIRNSLLPTLKSRNNNSTNSNTINSTSLHLQLLQQMLASDTMVPSSPQAIFECLTNITALSDLSKALDLLSLAKSIELNMGVEGSEFHTKVISHCREKLERVREDFSGEASFEDLEDKINYHNSLVSTFDIVHNYEINILSSNNNNNNNSGSNIGDDTDEDEDLLSPRTPWQIEALKWIDTDRVIRGEATIDLPREDEKNDTPLSNQMDPIHLSTFAKTCTRKSQKEDDNLEINNISIHDEDESSSVPMQFCDSTKDRKIVLAHVFRPFLQDIFVYNVVNSIFNSMKLENDLSLLQQYFCEWFMSIPAETAAKSSTFGTWCPILRWLQEILTKEYENEENIVTIPLKPILDNCAASSDLPKAFLLASVCLEAVSIVSKLQEKKTYGKVLSLEAIKPWENLLRKLRICLFIYFRLGDYGKITQFPINPKNIEAGSYFSVFEWIARDELETSHKQDEIAKVEHICTTSSSGFNPYDPDADAPKRWKLLQKNCIEYSQDNIRKKEHRSANKHFVSTYDYFPLLMYIQSHSHPLKLAAHRALLLGSKWGGKPGSLHILKDAVNALKFLGGDESTSYQSIVSSVRIEIWQIYIRPIFRALLFGFDDVHEVSEDVMAPLCVNSNWLRGLANVAGDVLELIEMTPIIKADDDMIAIEHEEAEESDTNYWPPVHENDVIFDSLIARSHDVNMNALHAHRAVVSVVQMITDDKSIIEPHCDEFSDFFLQHSLYTNQHVPPVDETDRTELLTVLLEKKVESIGNKVVDHFELGEINRLGVLWNVDIEQIRSRFMLMMYRFGKDAAVDVLILSSFKEINLEIFAKGAIGIICNRLNQTMIALKKARNLRSIIGMLDADTCDWIRDHAQLTSDEYPIDRKNLPPLTSTHNLVLKLLQISNQLNSSESNTQIQSLSKLTEDMLVQMELKEEQTKYTL